MERRPISISESLQQTRRSMGDGTLEGRSSIATPWWLRQRRANPLASAPATFVGDGGPGETLTVVAENVGVSTSPTVVQFDATWGDVAGFDNANIGAGELTPTFANAYYDIQVELVRGSYAGQVQVEILRGNEVVWPPPQSRYWDDPAVPVSAKGRLSKPS